MELYRFHPECSVELRRTVGKDVEIIRKGAVDCVIVESENGFSQLGNMLPVLSEKLGLGLRNEVQHVFDGFPNEVKKNIADLSEWNRFENQFITLIAIPSERTFSSLKGLILVPYDGSKCYEKYTGWRYGTPRPHRDFFYNVTYEAISYAVNKWDCRNIGLTHFYRERKYMSEKPYHRDMTTCQVEAISHFCSENRSAESFTFMDMFEGNNPLEEVVEEFNGVEDIGCHRAIVTHTLQHDGVDFVTLNWD